MFKKNLALVLAVCMLFGMISVSGLVRARAEDTTETIDLSSKGYADAATVTSVDQGAVSVAFAKGSGSNPPKYYTAGTAVRTYIGNTTTISVPDGEISQIKFYVKNGQSKNTGTLTVGTTKYSRDAAGEYITWTGASQSVTFTTADAQVHFVSIAVTHNSTSTGVQPSPTETEEPSPFVKPTTPEEIVNAAYDLEIGATLQDGPYTLTGEVTEIAYAYQTGATSISVWIVVGNMTDKRIECYKLENGENFGEGEGIAEVKVGDTITVTGQLTRFNASTVEFAAGCKLRRAPIRLQVE